jgi:sigma-B regulation protein RsbU (phosphoserine phosphatase)
MGSGEKVMRLVELGELIQDCRQRLQSLNDEKGIEQGEQIGKVLLSLDALGKGFEQYHGLFEKAVQGIFISTVEGEGVDGNQAFANMLGYESADELSNIKDFGAKHYATPSDRPGFLAALREKGELVNNEVRLKRLDGELIYVITNIRLTENGLLEGITIDITARKLAEERLRQSEEKYRRIVETAGEGFLLMDGELAITDVNEAYCRMIGYSRQEIIGKTAFDFASEEYRQFLTTHREELLAREYREFEGTLIGKDGKEIPVLVHANTLRDDQGEVIGNMAFVTDMTQHKRALALAGEVQKSLLPQGNLRMRGLDIAGRSIACDEIGGDYFDYLCGEECASGPFGVVVGDISGHGVDAALLMTAARSFLRMRASQVGSISQVIDEMNRHLTLEVLDAGRFMTLFYMTVDPENGCLRWVRAGHDPAIVYDPATDNFEELKGSGLALGVDEEYAYQENVRMGLGPGEIIVVSTDGIWEASNKDGNMFGKERLREIIRQNRSKGAEDILKAVYGELHNFTLGLRPEDDRTLVVVKVEAGS